MNQKTKSDVNMKNKKLLILIISTLLITCIIIGLLVLKNKNEDNKVKKTITPIAERFYEETYYPTTNEEILKKFTSIGIKISLEELIEFEEENIDDYKKYDTSKSNISIYPKKPFGKEDYMIKIELFKD